MKTTFLSDAERWWKSQKENNKNMDKNWQHCQSSVDPSQQIEIVSNLTCYGWWDDQNFDAGLISLHSYILFYFTLGNLSATLL